MIAIQGETDSALARAQPASPAADYTAALPSAAPMDKLLRESFKTAARSGVTIVSAEPQQASNASPKDLTYATLVLRMTGGYAGIKGVLAEILARFPGLAVQHLRIQRASGGVPGGAEVTVTLQQWLRPQPPSVQQTAVRQGG